MCRRVLRHCRWLEFRILHSQLLVKAQTQFVESSTGLADAFHSLDSGEIDRDTVVQLHASCKKDKAELRKAFDAYWAEPEGLPTPIAWNSGPKYTQETFRIFLHSNNALKVEQDLSIPSIKREIANRTLHCLIVIVRPVFALWPDVAQCSGILEESLQKLSKYTEPRSVGLIRATKALRMDVACVMARMDSLVIKPLDSDNIKLAEVNILHEDLLKITMKVDECLKQGSTFDEETFGTTRDELIRWRTLVNEKKSLLSHRETEERKENSARTDMHLKGKKVDWPATISQDTWYHFLKTWKREEVFIVGDYYKVKHLLSHLT